LTQPRTIEPKGESRCGPARSTVGYSSAIDPECQMPGVGRVIASFWGTVRGRPRVAVVSVLPVAGFRGWCRLFGRRAARAPTPPGQVAPKLAQTPATPYTATPQPIVEAAKIVPAPRHIRGSRGRGP
jgi:hypothetical protein